MSERRLFVALSVAVLSIVALLALFSAVEGEYPAASMASAVSGPVEINASEVGSSASPSAPASSPQISPPIEVTNISSMMPNILYLGLERQTMTPSQYQAAPHSANNLWIQANGGWLQYAVVPVGVTTFLIAISPAGGRGQITDQSLPDGLKYSSNFDFYPYSQIPYRPSETGKHQISFSIGGQESNTVTIDVVEPHYYHGYRLSLNPVEPEYQYSG